MNRFEKILGKRQQAEIKYLDGEFQVLAQGDFVICAVSGEQIVLQDLKYWSVECQEAYATVELSFQAMLKRRAS